MLYETFLQAKPEKPDEGRLSVGASSSATSYVSSVVSSATVWPCVRLVRTSTL